ncbi:hypothetical protein [Gordonia sihwensis]|uniref:hypothetical protein n=1 Tax=Gordonia TaxID=2053 RepID=UPI002416E299|nr:hypothetical protein [Gordonia sihwensis]WFN93483.1 hypothetical protein P5P27_02605 [Gordonia sihwensis]
MASLGTHLGDILLRCRVFGLATPPGEPPMMQAQLSITGEDADLALPVLKGDPGEPGTPAAPFKWQGQVASAGELPTLSDTPADKGKAYVVSDGTGTGDIAYWSGTTWNYFVDAFGPGLPGPVPDITTTGELVDEADPFEVVVSGPASAPNLHFKVPAQPGPPGPGGDWGLYDKTSPRPNGAVPVWDATAGLYKPVGPGAAAPGVSQYTLPESAWSAYSGNAATQTVATMALPALPYDYHIDVSGHARIGQGLLSSTQVALLVRLNDPTSGQIVGKGLGVHTGVCDIGPHFSSQESGKQSAAAAPGTATGRVSAGTAATLYVVGVRESGSGTWTLGQADAQLRVLTIPDLG